LASGSSTANLPAPISAGEAAKASIGRPEHCFTAIAAYMLRRFDSLDAVFTQNAITGDSMRRALALAVLFAVALPTLATAQDHDDHHDDRGRAPPPHPGGPPPPAPPHPGGPPLGAKPFVQQQQQQQQQFQQHQHDHGPLPGPMGGPHPPGPPPAAFVHPGVPPGPQFSYRGHMIERVHREPYIYPPGWTYQRWEVGAVLPPFFLARDYWFADWAALGFDPPPPGYEWVRYGPDLLLVDINSGQVVDVAYDVFY
jgi:Ni/Co efflux regulator RcnB